MVKIVKNSVGARSTGSRGAKRGATRTGASSGRRKPAPKKGVPAIVWVGGIIFIIIIATVVVSMNSGNSTASRQKSTSSYKMPRATNQRHKGEMGDWMKQHGTDKIAVERKKAHLKAYRDRKKEE